MFLIEVQSASSPGNLRGQGRALWYFCSYEEPVPSSPLPAAPLEEHRSSSTTAGQLQSALGSYGALCPLPLRTQAKGNQSHWENHGSNTSSGSDIVHTPKFVSLLSPFSLLMRAQCNWDHQLIHIHQNTPKFTVSGKFL